MRVRDVSDRHDGRAEDVSFFLVKMHFWYWLVSASVTLDPSQQFSRAARQSRRAYAEALSAEKVKAPPLSNALLCRFFACESVLFEFIFWNPKIWNRG